MRILDIVGGTTVDGPGLRTSIYFAGCAHYCPGCHNPQSWNPEAGRDMYVDEVMDVINENGFDVTLSGGDPLFQAEEILPLVKRIHAAGKSIWCYTGFTYEEVVTKPVVNEMLGYIDVLVDGPFIESLRDVHLLFRGSSNQRLIDLRNSVPGNIRLWEDDTAVIF